VAAFLIALTGVGLLIAIPILWGLWRGEAKDAVSEQSSKARSPLLGTQSPSPPEQPESMAAPATPADAAPATPADAAPATPADAAPAQYSADGRWLWDGQRWRPVAAGPAWMSWYAPSDTRATAAIRLVGLATAGLALFLVGEGLGLMAALIAPGSLLDAAAAVIQPVGGFAALVGFVGAAIAVPMWMHRCYRNLPALGATDVDWSPAWATGAWFIPGANLVIPYMVARELWAKASGPVVRSSPLLSLWWAACIAAVVINIVGNFQGNVQVDQTRTSFGPAGRNPVFDSLAALAAVVAGGLLITIIQRITRRQRDRHAELSRGG
jgi:uncharacterized protein DUF4328